MSSKNLKHKLDNLPNDLDKEALWNRINPESEKRRGGLWYVIGTMAIILLATVIYFLHSADVESTKIPVVLKRPIVQSLSTLDKENVIINQHSSTGTNQPEDTIKSVGLKSLEEEKVVTRTISNIHLTSTEVEYSNYNNGRIGDQFRTLSPDETKKYRDVTTLRTVPISDDITGLVLYQQNNKEIFGAPGYNSDHTPTDTAMTLLNTDLYVVSSIPPLLKTVDDNSIDKELLTPLIIPALTRKKENKGRPYFLSIVAAMGLDNHHFSNDEIGSMRNDMEDQLETVSISLRLSRLFEKRILISSGISFSRSQTVFTWMETAISYLYVHHRNPIVNSIATEYRFYNEYYRWDMTFGIGYLIDLGYNWSVIPQAELGYNAKSYQNVDILDRNLSIVDLSSITAYQHQARLFGSFQLSAQKLYISNKFIRIGMKVETPRMLGIQPFDQTTSAIPVFKHKIMPVSLYLSGGYRF